MAVTKTAISATTYCIASCKNNFLILKQGSGKCASNFPSSMFFFFNIKHGGWEIRQNAQTLYDCCLL